MDIHTKLAGGDIYRSGGKAATNGVHGNNTKLVDGVRAETKYHVLSSRHVEDLVVQTVCRVLVTVLDDVRLDWVRVAGVPRQPR